MDKLSYSKIKVKNLFSEGVKSEFQEIGIENGVIKSINSISKDSNFDYENLAPALVDNHINGGEHLHFTCTPTEECLWDIESAAAKNGTGYVLPTIITSSIENIFDAITATKNYLTKNPNSGVLGMHLEGPFLNKAKRGAHLEKYILKPTDDLIKQIIDFGENTIKLITIAPELFSDKQTMMLLESGIKVSAGHSNATFAEAQHAFDLGINLVTHLFNAMSPFTHRAVGLAGATLLNQQVYAPIILDNIHVANEAAKMAYHMKTDKLFLISDALFQNYTKTEFKWEEFDAKLINNQYLNSDGNLAGGTFSLGEVVQNAKNVLSINNATAINMATAIPAQMIDTSRKIGKIAIGYEAKFCNFNDNLSDFKLQTYHSIIA